MEKTGNIVERGWVTSDLLIGKAAQTQPSQHHGLLSGFALLNANAYGILGPSGLDLEAKPILNYGFSMATLLMVLHF